MKLANIFGVKIAYFDSAPDADEDKPCLFFVHGWAGNSSGFFNQLQHLSADYRCILVDLPGHGQSAKPAFEYSIVLYAEILLGLCAKLNLMKPVLLGHSMGGCIALEMVHQQPDAAAAVILLDPAMIVDDTKVRALFARSLDDLRESGVRTYVAQKARTMFFDPKTPEDVLAWAEKSARQLPEHVAISSWAAMLDWQGKAALRKAAHLPVAYIASSKPSNRQEDIRAIAPKIRWAQPLETNHNLHISSAVQVNAMIGDFLSALGYTGGTCTINPPPAKLS